MLQAVLARGAPEGGFWPKLGPGFGIFGVDAIMCGSVPREGAKYSLNSVQ